MWEFVCNVVTLKSDNRIGDLVGVVLKNNEGVERGFSLEELTRLVENGETLGMKLVTYVQSDGEGKEIGGGHLVFFEDDRPLLLDKIAYHKDLEETSDIVFSKKMKAAIIESPYR